MSPSLMKETILLIEDEVELQQNLKEILEFNGFNVLTADNGQDALMKIKDQEFDLILCDIMMPNVDGFQFLRILRSEERFHRTPFIFLSAKVSVEDKLKGIQEGADDYLGKPISARLLLNAIFGALDRKKEKDYLPYFMNESILGDSQSHLLPENDTPLTSLLIILDKLKTVTESIDRKEISRLVYLALTSAQLIHGSLYKLPLFKSLEKSSSIPRLINLNDLILFTINELGAEMFLFRFRPILNFIFDPEQIRFVIRELFENSIKFSSDMSLVEIELFGNELSIKNKQSIFGQIEEIQIEAFYSTTPRIQERRGLGLGLFLCKEYCRKNQAKLYCSVDSEGNFIVQILF